jgi:probable HAF family extracellular repeat protein
MGHAIVRAACFATIAAVLAAGPFDSAAAVPGPRLSEIGTLGGYVGSSSGSAINKRGWVVGRADVADGQQAFLWKDRNVLLLLGTLGGSFSEATDINDTLQVVGNSADASGELQAFLWTESGGMSALPLSAISSRASAISEAGHVVGTLRHEDGVDRAYLWLQGQGVSELGTFGDSPTFGLDVNDVGAVIGSYTTGELSKGFYWSSATGFRDLGTLGGPGPTTPRMINNNGQIVGSTTDIDGHFRAFRWTLSGGMVALGSLGLADGSAAAISRQGDVVGTSGGHAVLWPRAGGITDLGTLGGAQSSAEGLSPDGGIVTGWSHTAAGAMHAFRWTAAAGMVDLGAIGIGSSIGSRVNNAGRAFGGGITPAGSFRAFVWDAGGMTDVGTSSGQTSQAVSLSEAGHVAGDSPAPGGAIHAFLWTAAGGMRDLGDLGGGTSQSVVVNSAGNVAGHSTSIDGAERGFFWSLATGMLDLGSFDGAQVIVAGMNAQSVVVGTLVYKDGETARSRGYRWTLSGVQLLLPLPGASECSVAAVNGQGGVVGTSRGADGVIKAVLWEPGQTIPVLLVDPGSLGGTEAQGTHLSDSGWTAGYVQLGVDPPSLTRRGWVRDPSGTVRLLEDAGGGSFIDRRSVVFSLNEAGDAAGGVKGDEQVERPALWKALEVTPAGTRALTLIAGPQAIGQAHSINGAMHVAGILEADSGETQAFLWTAPGGLQLLGSLGGTSMGLVRLNGSDRIAGTGSTAAGFLRAFVWPLSKF